MENKKQEQMIYIKDLLFAALRGWRIVLVAAAVLALVLGGAKVLSALTVPEASAEAMAEAMAQYEAEKILLEQRVAAQQENLLDRTQYYENSVLMGIDPYNHFEAALSLYVDTGYQIQPGVSQQDPDKTETVLEAYRAVAMGQSTLTAMAQNLETENRYVAELITAEIDEATATLGITIKATTSEQAEQLMEIMARQLEGAYTQVEAAVVSHTPRLLGKTVRARVDTALAENQKAENTRLNDNLTALADAQNKLAALVAPAVQTVSFGTALKQTVIFTVLGGVAGAFITVCVIWVMHIAGTKVYSERALKNRTDIKVIGCLCDKTHKNKIDRWLYRLEGRNTAEKEQQAALLATDISCRTQAAGTLLVTGSGTQEDREAMVGALQKLMPGTAVRDCGSLLDTAQALEALHSADAVVLVERCDSSRYADISRQMQLICDYNKQLVGCVLLDG